MKNLYKLFGIIGIIAIIGFSMTACDNGSTDTSGGSGGGGDNPAGDTDVVLLTDDSDAGLTAGDGKIKNLDAEKYYVVVKDGTTFYVTGGGILSLNLEDIGLPAGGEITGLKNGDTYKVNAAELFADDNLPLFLHTGKQGELGDTEESVEAESGVITLSGDNTLTMYGIDLKLPYADKYEIWMVMPGFDFSSDENFEEWAESRTSAKLLGEDPEDFIKDNDEKDIGLYQFNDTQASVIYVPAKVCDTTFWIVNLTQKTLTYFNVVVASDGTGGDDDPEGDE